MKIHPFPPRLDTSYVLDGLLTADEVPQILSDAQRRYEVLNSAPPWSEIRWQKEVAIHKTGFICLYQALADWLKVHKVNPRNLQDQSGSISIRSPTTIRSEGVARELDLAFLFAALASSLKYHAFLVLPENGSLADALLALAVEPDLESAIESGAVHTLNFRPAYKDYPGDSRGSDRYYEASRRGLKKEACCLVMPLEFEAAAESRFAPYLERAVFNVLTRTGASNGTGFFVTRDGYALTCHHVLEDEEKQPVYDDRNRFSIRYLNKAHLGSAEWFPQLSNKTKDVAVVKVRVEQEGFSEFATLPLGGDYGPGLKACLRGFCWPESYPLGYFCSAEVSPAEKSLAVTIYEEGSVQLRQSDAPQKPSKRMIKLIDGTFVHGMSGAPVVRMDTGQVFGVHRAWVDANNWGLCIPVKTFLRVWRAYSPFWPDLAFS